MNSTPLTSLDGVTLLLLLEQSSTIAEQAGAWKDGGVFHYAVPQTPRKVLVAVRTKDRLNNDFWVARTNTFEELDPAARRKLGQQLLRYSIGLLVDLQDSHTKHEEHYIEELYDFNLSAYELPETPAGYDAFSYLTELFYKLQWPLKRRRFCNLVHILRKHDDSEAYVVSLAVDPALIPNAAKDAGVVDAQYSSVERLVLNGDSVHWFMTTCSDAKGNVPQWLARQSINGVVAKDVPHFLKWVATKE